VSIPSLITAYGRSLTRIRPTIGRDTAGAVVASTTAATATATISGYLQQAAGAAGDRYGRENTQYTATLYCVPGTDVKETDLVRVTINSETRTYRVESVRIPDDRATSDLLGHMIISLQEDLPRT
jgi:hypothetical protein